MEEPGTIVVGTDGSETAERAVDRAGTRERLSRVWLDFIFIACKPRVVDG